VQEAFLRFWRARDRGDRDGATRPIEDPVAYLFACVKRAAMDWQRGGRRRGLRENSVAAARSEASTDAALLGGSLEREERRAAVEAALARLPEPQREVLVLKVWAGLSFPQIGQALGVSPDTAASRYRYGLAKLREQLAEELIP
jgi:RNA polymerase sigma-70 factor (ECF subfamily)